MPRVPFPPEQSDRRGTARRHGAGMSPQGRGTGEEPGCAGHRAKDAGPAGGRRSWGATRCGSKGVYFSKPPWEWQRFTYDFKNLQNFCLLGALTGCDRGCESTSSINF